MKAWLKFVGVGLILALFTEAQLKLIAGINPPAFIVAVLVYPIILTLAYGVHRLTDRLLSSSWKADLLYYLASGIVGLGIEWTLLGNGPQSNAFQPGMFAMWTTFLFGPRILNRNAPLLQKSRRRFWLAFTLVALLLTVIVLLINNTGARVVVTVFALSGTYMVWSVWLLVLAWRARQRACGVHDSLY